MRVLVLALMVIALAGSAAAEPTGQCREQQLLSARTSGPLALASEGDQLFLTFAHQDSEIGLTYPMRVTVKGRRLTATIRQPLERISMPALGTNYGRVALPRGLAGDYRLDVRFGEARASYTLAVGDGVTVTPRGAVAPELAFGVHEWRRVPPGYSRVRCVERTACAVEACAQVLSTPPLSTMQVLPNGAYLDVTSYTGTCVGALTNDDLAVLRKRSAELEAKGCGLLAIDAADAR